MIVNGEQTAVLLTEGEQVIDLSDRLTADTNDVLLFKRQDACHAFTLRGFIVAAEARLLPLAERPARRIEVYGDSVSAGEVSEAEFACGQPDPEGHNGLYSNSWWSYAWQAARLMRAELHDVATGGIALLDRTGYYHAPDYIGMESAWDKVNHTPDFGPVTPWDFTRWTPHVVIVAIGQNDHHPINSMAEDYDSAASAHWRAAYQRFLARLREKYPKAYIVCTTTIIGHDAAWDRAIDECVQAMGDGRMHHFLSSRNGCGTPSINRKTPIHLSDGPSMQIEKGASSSPPLYSRYGPISSSEVPSKPMPTPEMNPRSASVCSVVISVEEATGEDGSAVITGLEGAESVGFPEKHPGKNQTERKTRKIPLMMAQNTDFFLFIYCLPQHVCNNHNSKYRSHNGSKKQSSDCCIPDCIRYRNRSKRRLRRARFGLC